MRAFSMSFGIRIYLLVSILILVVMATAASYFLVTQNQALKDALSEQARSLSGSLSEGVRLGVILDDRQFVEQAAAGMLGLPNLLYIDIYRRDGGLIQSFGQFKHPLKLKQNAIDQSRNFGFYQSEEGNDLQQRGARDFLTPIWAEAGSQELVGYVRLGLSTEAISKRWKSMLKTTIWATLLLVLFGCALLYLPMRRIIRPINELSDGALRIAEGDLDFRIAIERDDEIGRLAENFNHMSKSLRSQSDEIRQKTDALKTSERKFRELFENIAQPLYINALDGRLVDCNQAMADLFGYQDRETMIREVRGGYELYANPDERIDVLSELLSKGEIKERELEFVTRDGEALQVLVTSRVRYNEDGEAIGFEGMIQDVTEMRQLQEQFLHIQKMESIGTLAGGIAHDFNNLIAVILSSAELAHIKLDDRDMVLKHLNSIKTASKRASELTRGLLGFARKGKTRVEEINSADLLHEVDNLLRETIDRRIGIYTDVAPDLWPIKGNPTQIHQVLVNLCVNARDAILDHGGSELKISMRNIHVDHPRDDLAAGPYVLIDVSDDGGGIPDSVRERIFDPFFTTKAIDKGTGLGLATVYGIVESHDGFLTLDTKVGEGTTFHVYLPAVTNETESPAVTLASQHEPTEVQLTRRRDDSLTVLVVDDEEILRFVSKEYLEEQGCRVILAENGEIAVEKLAEHCGEIDLVVLDLVMPVMGGEQVLKIIRQDYPDVKVIIASGYSERGLYKNLSHQSYDGYIEKPFDLDRLGEMMQQLFVSEAESSQTES